MMPIGMSFTGGRPMINKKQPMWFSPISQSRLIPSAPLGTRSFAQPSRSQGRVQPISTAPIISPTPRFAEPTMGGVAPMQSQTQAQQPSQTTPYPLSGRMQRITPDMQLKLQQLIQQLVGQRTPWLNRGTMPSTNRYF